jgi:anti-sigma B factor antagonist
MTTLCPPGLRWPFTTFPSKQVGTATVVDLPYYSLLEEEAMEATGAQLSGLAEQAGQRGFVLNCQRLPGLNSALLTKLVSFHRQVKAAGGRLALCAVAPDVGELLVRANLHRLFRVYPTEREALASL